jgi:DNA invertase Pin-like site-specific DNA recombinase
LYGNFILPTAIDYVYFFASINFAKLIIRYREWHNLQQMGVDIVVLDMPIASTADKSDLEKKLIVNIVFELLAYLSEKERLKIKMRQAEGIAAAKKNGVNFGRPKIKAPNGFIEEVRKWMNGEQTAIATMTKLGLKRTTFYKLVKEVSL